MVFVKRDDARCVCAIFERQNASDQEQLEELENDHPDVALFLSKCLLDKQSYFLKSDLEFIRVVEDLIQILMEKNLISITDFSEVVINKLVSRKGIRQQFKNVTGIISDEG